jgi:16S rRNA (uracil1498-N3)-methyltransferase
LHKRERLERIIKEAAEQSGRGFIPKLSEPEKLKDVFAKSAKTNEGINIIAHPETKNSIAGVYGKIKKEKINLFIGPEGGFSENEISSAQESGFLAFSLGKRILRAETAAITIPAVLLAL